MTTDIDPLIARVRDATGPDREIDAQTIQYSLEITSSLSRHARREAQMSTALHQRMLAFDYADGERAELMAQVWSGTPWMLNIKTGSPSEPEGMGMRWRIRTWCEEHCGHAAWPLHGRPGQWQFGTATIFGWEWIGFATEAQMRAFMAAFPECEPTEDER